MKKIKFLSFAILTAIIAFACNNNSSSTSNADEKMKELAADAASMKSYVIEYKVVMSAEQIKSTTTTTQWIDVSNDRFAIESVSETEMMGKKQSGKTLIIDDGEWSYMIDMATKSGYKSKSGEGEDDPTDMIKSDDDVTFRQMIEKEGGNVLANENFLGKDCIVVELKEKDDDGKVLPTKMWYYKGIPLKIMNSTYTMEATKFEEGVSIPTSRFEVPTGITVTEMPGMPE